MRLVNSDSHAECIKEIVSSAKQYIVFMSPFWCVAKNGYDVDILRDSSGNNFSLDDLFEDALSRGVRILLLCKHDQLLLLQKHFEVFYKKYNRKCSVFSLDMNWWSETSPIFEFHSKVYMNESLALVTSRNISGFKRNTIDLGVLISEDEIIEELKDWMNKLFLEVQPVGYLQRFLNKYIK